jgi:hypothetical protein
MTLLGMMGEQGLPRRARCQLRRRCHFDSRFPRFIPRFSLNFPPLRLAHFLFFSCCPTPFWF